VSLNQLAQAWTPSRPALQVAVVGARNASHAVDDDAVSLELTADVMEQIDQIMVDGVPVVG
jgi:aryl-alcohol dehydrogenase-like predicted oxidoreductase